MKKRAKRYKIIKAWTMSAPSSIFFRNFAAFNRLLPMNIANILTSNDGETRFSFEVLPPLKGNGTESLFP